MVSLSLVNLGEILYIVERKMGPEASRETLNDVLRLPIDLAEVTTDRVISAAHIKANFPISYADAFATALAQEMAAEVITGDHEFKYVESLINVLWL